MTRILETKVYSPVCNKHYTLGIWLEGEGENVSVKQFTLTGKYVRYGYIFEATIPVNEAELEKLGIDLRKALKKALRKVLVD